MRAISLSFFVAGWLFFYSTTFAQPKKKPSFELAPSVAVEAEDFKIESGWKVIQNGQGNYMVDIIGFNHISGERVLSLDAKAKEGSAFVDVTLPEAGDYRLWVRYEYPPFCETRFEVEITQGERIANFKMGAKDNPRYAFGDRNPKAQYDPAWGPEGLVEEGVSVTGLRKGPARITLKGVAQPQLPGVAANRNIDFVWLTRDTQDAWRNEYAKQINLYPILGAFRDARGPRWEVQFTNRGDRPASFAVSHTYNRLPWGASEGVVAKDVAPGAASEWTALKQQDTSHFNLVTFTSNGAPFDIALRGIGGEVERTGKGATQYAFYVPPYPGKGDQPATQIERIDAVLQHLAKAKPVGKTPTEPLCYGGWLPVGKEDPVGRKYAELYAAIGMRSLHPANGDVGGQIRNLANFQVPPSKSWMVMGYRNPPTAANILKAKDELDKNGMKKWLQWFDYGDEIAFSEWIGEMVNAEAAATKQKPDDILAQLWRTWLKEKRPTAKLEEYWMPNWGGVDANKLKPDSSADAAKERPKLYVDSLSFYEDTAIAHVAAGRAAVKKVLGNEILCGANYSAHPFYYPPTNMYVKWFRGGAADMGRHSEYFWQVGQAGPMINGYVAEHFRCGMRDNPKAVLRQYTMPHSPGNSEASFLRSAFSHLAHGAKMLDFFGIGMNETFTENHIDHRDVERYRCIRDVTHAIGMVEDMLPQSTVEPSQVALLVSESTERWDFAGIATDKAGHAHFGPDFRKTRTHYHLERLGLWKALTFLGSTPDLIVEDDVKPALMKGYRVLILVGDSFPAEKVAALDDWVKAGGVLLATGEAGLYDSYKQPNESLTRLLGIKSRKVESRVTFMRPRQELPYQRVLGTISADDWNFPQIALAERVEPVKGVQVMAKYRDDNSPAVLTRAHGSGRVVYVAALPGVSYLWSALQPPIVPDRSPTSHLVPTNFDPGVRKLLEQVLEMGRVRPAIVADPPLIDGRILKAPKGYIVPLGNYHEKVGQKVNLTLRLDGRVLKVTSAYHGTLPFTNEGGQLKVTIPALGYGDVLRLDP